jgi:hypothetical protein
MRTSRRWYRGCHEHHCLRGRVGPDYCQCTSFPEEQRKFLRLLGYMHHQIGDALSIIPNITIIERMRDLATMPSSWSSFNCHTGRWKHYSDFVRIPLLV